ncbi:MAG: hypothetical protein H9W81_16510 [Enterococcus sp.]|nr:hypothetical protein [Enterococcus sp.]
MSKGPWRIKGEFRVLGYEDFFTFQEREFSTFEDAELTLTHLVASGQKFVFRGDLELVNENNALISSFKRNPHNYGPKVLLVETNMDLTHIKRLYNHGYRLDENLRFYYQMSSEKMTLDQKYIFNYLVTALHNAALYLSGPDLINTVHEGNSESLYDMVMAGKDIDNATLSNAIRGVAIMTNRDFV